MATFLSGKSGNVKSGTTSINIRKWTFTHTADALDVTNTSHAGKRTFISGLIKGEGSFDADVDTAALYDAATPGIIPGAQMTLNLIMDSTGKQYSFTAQITQVKADLDVEGKVTYSATFVSSGAITSP